MPRRSSFEVVLDSSLFTPSQLQPTAVGRLGFQGGTRWLRDHLVSHRKLVWEHRVGLVLWALELEYDAPLRFVDADAARVDVRGRVRGPASQLEVEMTVAGPAGVAVRTRAAFVPLTLSGDAALSGAPGRLPEPLLARFRDDERERAPHRSRVPALRARLEREGRPLASGTTTFRVHRHNCEVADQWFWVEALGYAGGAREELVMRHGSGAPSLRRSLADGVRRIDMTCLRAYQLWDVLEVRTAAYEHDGGVAFVHELGLAEEDGGGPHAIAIEQA